MYHLDVFDKYHVNITWHDIYLGLKKDFLNLEDVRDYALRCLESEANSCEEINDLAWKNDDKTFVFSCIEKIIKNKGIVNDEESKSKWQYCIIKSLRDSILNYQELSSKLDELYADFDYPEDMEEFISYMPIKDGYNPAKHSKEDNIQRIMNKIDLFLDKKQKLITTDLS
ncbi:MAG: DUF2247 family protein [Pygmaiobacter massiliensis]